VSRGDATRKRLDSPVEAAVRETEEERGLEVVSGRILGRRTHPVADRLMIYLAARPAKRANIHTVVVNKRELDEARWLSRAEVSELMPDAYEPVLAHLD
jgi:8-oxo-dGTP diphosphatase